MAIDPSATTSSASSTGGLSASGAATPQPQINTAGSETATTPDAASPDETPEGTDRASTDTDTPAEQDQPATATDAAGATPPTTPTEQPPTPPAQTPPATAQTTPPPATPPATATPPAAAAAAAATTPSPAARAAAGGGGGARRQRSGGGGGGGGGGQQRAAAGGSGGARRARSGSSAGGSGGATAATRTAAASPATAPTAGNDIDIAGDMNNPTIRGASENLLDWYNRLPEEQRGNPPLNTSDPNFLQDPNNRRALLDKFREQHNANNPDNPLPNNSPGRIDAATQRAIDGTRTQATGRTNEPAQQPATASPQGPSAAFDGLQLPTNLPSNISGGANFSTASLGDFSPAGPSSGIGRSGGHGMG